MINKTKYIFAPIIALTSLCGCAGRGVYFNVTFKTNTGADDIIETVREGFRIKKPADPINPGFSFSGWYYDNRTFEYKYNFDTKVCQDFKLYAKWTTNPIVTLNSKTLTYTEALSTEEEFCGILSINDAYADDYDAPSVNTYYEIRIGGKRLNDFKMENLFSTSHSVKIYIPKESVTAEISITAEAYEKCLTFTANEATDISYSKNGSVDTSGLYYQLNSGSGWDDEVSWSDGAAVPLTTNQKMRVYNKKGQLNSSDSNYINFASTAPVAASGNVMSLLNFNNLKNYSFYRLFKGMPLTTAPVLPSTQLGDHCYRYMFENCANLKVAPILSATSFHNSCYNGMFKNSGVETAWINTENSLETYAFAEMFKDCNSLKSVCVGFGDGDFWPTQNNCTLDWLPTGAGSGKTFYWLGSTDIETLRAAGIYGDYSRIPDGWNVAKPY